MASRERAKLLSANGWKIAAVRVPSILLRSLYQINRLWY
jgi:hypothetical protein